MGKKIYRVWYRTLGTEMDFREYSAESEEKAVEIFHKWFDATILDVEETSFCLLEG